jgi:anaerobic selenocysteine-containing dehydrogenase
LVLEQIGRRVVALARCTLTGMTTISLIKQGDWVFIETPEGKTREKAELTDRIDPRVVHADAYWWFPEKPGNEPSLFGVWDSNINAIIPRDPKLFDYAGDYNFRGLLCKVYKE